jgi:hypothetical protein
MASGGEKKTEIKERRIKKLDNKSSSNEADMEHYIYVYME